MSGSHVLLMVAFILGMFAIDRCAPQPTPAPAEQVVSWVEMPDGRTVPCIYDTPTRTISCPGTH